MNLSALLSSPEDEILRSLEQSGEERIPIADEAQAVVRKGENGGYVADLQVRHETVVVVRERELHRFRQRLREQIAIHIPRDQQPDLTES